MPDNLSNNSPILSNGLSDNEVMKALEKRKKELEDDYKRLQIKAEVYKEFAEDIQGEIDDAIHSNYNAKEERIAKSKKLGIPIDSEDSFLMYCDGKIHALSGIRSYIENALKEKVGEDK